MSESYSTILRFTISLLCWVNCSCQLGVPPAVAAVATPIFDWSVRNSQLPGIDISPIPHPGADWPAGHNIYRSLYSNLDAQGLPVGLMLRDSTGPATGSRDPNALATVMSYAPRLDYVFSDFEDQNTEANILATVAQVRANGDPRINSAYIGNYNYFPGVQDTSASYPQFEDRTAKDHIYRTSGLNIAQPDCYPYEYYTTHLDRGLRGSYVSPNKRSALFWAPLERFSLAKRELPAGNKLIPWIAGFIAWPGYDAPPPAYEDNVALLQHLRMRGADGYYRLVGWYSNVDGLLGGYHGISDPTAATEAHRLDMLAAWHSLDWLYAAPASVNVLNLTTDKTSGVEWSGVSTPHGSVFLISNLGDLATSIDLPALPGIPELSPAVVPGVHLLLSYPLLVGDYNFNGVVDAADYTVWRDTLGSTYDLRANGDNTGASAGVIDTADYDVWRAHFGQTLNSNTRSSTASQMSVPEPSVIAAVVAWLLIPSLRHCRRACPARGVPN